MEDPEPVSTASTESASLQTATGSDVAHELVSETGNRYETQLRRFSGRSAAYRGPIIAIARAWVSRDSNLHIFSARFLDFAVLMPEYLVLCSTGFFTRRPRRQVFREPLGRLVVIPRGPEPPRTLRIVGDFDKPILLELRPGRDSEVFATELLGRTRRDPNDPHVHKAWPPEPGPADE